jgi:hypothetical protein
MIVDDYSLVPEPWAHCLYLLGLRLTNILSLKGLLVAVYLLLYISRLV